MLRRMLAYLPVSVELILVILLAAVWADAIQNVALSSVVRTAVPAVIGIGLGATLVRGSKSHRERAVQALRDLENHPYLKAIREEFGEGPKYSLGFHNYTAKQLLELHNHLPDRLELRSRMLHPMVEEEMEDWEHSGLEQTATVPMPEPWITSEETIAVGTMVDELYMRGVHRLNVSFPERIQYLRGIEDNIFNNLKRLKSFPWPEMVIDEEKVHFRANGTITGNRKAR